MVWPGDCVSWRSSGAGAGETQQFANDAGVAHRPSGARVERAGRSTVLVIRPAHAVGIGGCPGREILDEYVGEVEVLCLLNVPVAGQRQDSRRPAAVTAVVPEPGTDAARQAAVGHGMPASAGECGPGGVPGDRAEQPENLGVARRAVAPAVAVALDQVGPMLRVRMRTTKPSGPASSRAATSAAPCRARSTRSRRPTAVPTAARA